MATRTVMKHGLSFLGVVSVAKVHAFDQLLIRHASATMKFEEFDALYLHTFHLGGNKKRENVGSSKSKGATCHARSLRKPSAFFRGNVTQCLPSLFRQFESVFQ